MGKVAKPLTIVVFPPLDTWPEFEKMKKQGHTIISFCDVEKGFRTVGASCLEDAVSLMVEADIILGPKCWYMTELHRKHLTQAIKQARLRRYGTVSKKRKKGDDNEDGKTTRDNDSPDPESAGC